MAIAASCRVALIGIGNKQRDKAAPCTTAGLLGPHAPASGLPVLLRGPGGGTPHPRARVFRERAAHHAPEVYPRAPIFDPAGVVSGVARVLAPPSTLRRGARLRLRSCRETHMDGLWASNLI